MLSEKIRDSDIKQYETHDRLRRRNGLDMKWDGDEPRMTWKSRGKIEIRRHQNQKKWIDIQVGNREKTSEWQRVMDPVEQEATQGVKGMRVQLKVSDREKRGRENRDKNRTFLLLHCRIEKREESESTAWTSPFLSFCIQEWQEGRITQEWEGKRQGVTDTSCKRREGWWCQS